MPKIEVLNIANGESKKYEVQAAVPIYKESEDRSRGWVRAGNKNLYFKELVALVNGSGIASACVDTKARFITGGGFSYDEKDNAKKLFFDSIKPFNKQHEFFSPLTQIAKDCAFFEGFALNIRYNLMGEITEIRPIDFSWVRLGIANPDTGNIEKVYISPDWTKATNGSYKWAEPIEMPVFNPDIRQIRSEMKSSRQASKKPYTGQILYYKPYRPDSFYYTPPTWASADNRLSIDHQIGEFHDKNIENGFYPSMIMYWPGLFQGKTEDGRDKKTALKEDFAERKQGPENAGLPMHFFGERRDEAPSIISAPQNTNGEMFISIDNNTFRYIPAAFQVPAAIAMLETAGKLGGTQELLNAIEMFQNNIIKPMQDTVCNVMKVLQKYSMFKIAEPECEIKTYKPISNIPDQVWDALTNDEKRATAGYLPLDAAQKQEIDERTAKPATV